MKKYRILSFIIAILMVMVVAAGCGGNGSNVSKNVSVENGSQDSDAGESESDESEAEEDKSSSQDTDIDVSESVEDSSHLTESNESSDDEASDEEARESSTEPHNDKVQKIGTTNRNIYEYTETGMIYKEDNGMYGILSLDGRNDTGAKYTYCESLGDNYMVMMSVVTDYEDISTLNCCGVVDVSGNEVVPMKYASITNVSDRYVQVCEVTERTTNLEEALVYYSEDMFSFSASEDDILYKGVWYVYDVIGKRMVEGVSGTDSVRVYSCGRFIEYNTVENGRIWIDNNGEVLPKGAELFENGYYSIDEGNTGAVYDADGNRAFEYSEDGFVPFESEEDYIKARTYKDGCYTYVFMDKAGKIVSGEFKDRPYVSGKLVESGEKVYDLKGNLLIDESVQYIYCDEQSVYDIYFLRNGDKYTVIESDGTLLWEGQSDDEISVDNYSNFSICKSVDGAYMYYSFAEKDFTLKGTDVAPWLIKVKEADNTYSIVNSVTGEKIISGYSYYNISVIDSCTYIFAKYKNGVDIYIVK